MKITHHIALRLDNAEETTGFAKLGLKLPERKLASIDIAEDDPRWREVEALIGRTKYPIIDTVTTEFSNLELDGAKFLGMVATSSAGYPQPEQQQGYLASTYDMEHCCKRCGLGKRQIAPFRVSLAEPKRDKSIFQLNWIFDEFFLSREAWKAVFEPFGIGYHPVIAHNTGKEMDRLVQLDINDVHNLMLTGTNCEECSLCGRRKFPFNTKGFFPKPVFPQSDLFKSTEAFGAFGFSLVIVSHKLHRAMKRAALTGIKFYPCVD